MQTNSEELTLNIQLSALALRLRRLRMEKHISQKQLAKVCGIDVADIIAFENDKKKPTQKELNAILHFIGE